MRSVAASPSSRCSTALLPTALRAMPPPLEAPRKAIGAFFSVSS